MNQFIPVTIHPQLQSAPSLSASQESKDVMGFGAFLQGYTESLHKDERNEEGTSQDQDETSLSDLSEWIPQIKAELPQEILDLLAEDQALQNYIMELLHQNDSLQSDGQGKSGVLPVEIAQDQIESGQGGISAGKKLAGEPGNNRAASIQLQALLQTEPAAFLTDESEQEVPGSIRIYPPAEIESLLDSEQNLHKLYTRMFELLSMIQTKEDIPKVAVPLAKLVQEWNKEMTVNQSHSEQALLSESVRQVQTEVKGANSPQMDRQLMNLLADLNRGEQPLQKESLPHTEQKVEKWLQAVFKDISNAPVRQESLPISKVEQLVLHVGQSEENKGISGKQLIEKLDKMIQAQRIHGFMNGQTALSIRLRPENLGDMTIRFIKVDGDMTVQMLVNSKAVKEILESNMHQLRTVFSPHQVTVERQENVALANAENAKDAKDNQQEGQQAEQQEHLSDTEEQDNSNETESFEAFMEKLLSESIEGR